MFFTIAGLRAFHQWTHESLDVVFEQAAKFPEDLFVRELPGFGFATVRDQFVHILESPAPHLPHVDGGGLPDGINSKGCKAAGYCGHSEILGESFRGRSESIAERPPTGVVRPSSQPRLYSSSRPDPQLSSQRSASIYVSYAWGSGAG